MSRVTLFACLVGLLLVAGCAMQPKPEAPPEPVGRDSLEPDPEALTEIADLQDRVQFLEGELAAARNEASSNELRRIDAETRLARLQKRYEELELAHTEAISEVVRAQAKLRGSVSQADAASDIAEAEITLSTAELPPEDLAQARNNLDQASQEFDQGNYGGALYLSNQAKRLISEAEARHSNGVDFVPVADEVRFESPLALVVRDNTNVRVGPSLKDDILTTLQSGTPVDGFSYSGSWVRVKLEDGQNGWIYQTLLTARDLEELEPTTE